MAKDMITKYYDKREHPRIYYITLDEIFIAKGRIEYVGRWIFPSWLGSKNIEIEV